MIYVLAIKASRPSQVIRCRVWDPIKINHMIIGVGTFLFIFLDVSTHSFNRPIDQANCIGVVRVDHRTSSYRTPRYHLGFYCMCVLHIVLSVIPNQTGT